MAKDKIIESDVQPKEEQKYNWLLISGKLGVDSRSKVVLMKKYPLLEVTVAEWIEIFQKEEINYNNK